MTMKRPPPRRAKPATRVGVWAIDHPPQITENEAHIWQALSQAAEHAEKASLALHRARQMILRDTPEPVDGPFWALAMSLLHAADVFAAETLAERQRAARRPNHTDLMVTPESIDAFMEANPLPDEDPK